MGLFAGNTNLWVSGMFRTEHLQSLAVGFAQRVVHVTKESRCPGDRQTNIKKEQRKKKMFLYLHQSLTYPSIRVGKMDPNDV